MLRLVFVGYDPVRARFHVLPLPMIDGMLRGESGGRMDDDHVDDLEDVPAP